MTGEHFFAGRRFVATRDLKALRYPASSGSIADSSSASYLALYWMDYMLGLQWLLLLSMLHVFLEFPLNWLSFFGIKAEIAKRFSPA